MTGQVCVDAGVVLPILIPHDLAPQADALWRAWATQDTALVTAPLFFAEVTSVLREHVYHGRISAEDGEEAFATFMNMKVRSLAPASLQLHAWSLAQRYNLPRAYDAQYLAVATVSGCDLWTADRRLVNAINAPWVRWIGEHAL